MVKLNTNVEISYSNGYYLIHNIAYNKEDNSPYVASIKTYALVETALGKLKEMGIECSEKDYILAKKLVAIESAKKGVLTRERFKKGK